MVLYMAALGILPASIPDGLDRRYVGNPRGTLCHSFRAAWKLMVLTAQATRVPQPAVPTCPKSPSPLSREELLIRHRGRAACGVWRSTDLEAHAPRPAPTTCPTSASTSFGEEIPTHSRLVHPAQTAQTQTLTEYVVAPGLVEGPQCCAGRSPAFGGRGLQAATGTSRQSTETDAPGPPLRFPEADASGIAAASDSWRRASAACGALAMVQTNRRGGTLAFRVAFGVLRDALAACPASATRQAAHEQRGP